MEINVFERILETESHDHSIDSIDSDRKILITQPLCHATVQGAFPIGTFADIGQ